MRLTLASCIALAVLLYILVSASSAPSSSTSSAEPAVGGQPFTFTVVGAESVLQQLQRLGDTPNELSQVDYSARQPPLDCIPGLLVVVGAPILLCGSAALYVWRSASGDAGGQLDDAERLREISSVQHPERERRSAT